MRNPVAKLAKAKSIDTTTTRAKMTSHINAYIRMVEFTVGNFKTDHCVFGLFSSAKCRCRECALNHRYLCMQLF